MSQASFCRELAVMNEAGARYPYAKLLKEKFNMEAPPGAPKYQVEYLYKYALNGETSGAVPADQIIDYASKKAAELFDRFPWLTKKYDDVVVASQPREKSTRLPRIANHPDGTIIFCPKRNGYACYVGGVMISCRSDEEKVKEYATKQYKITTFNKIS